VGDGGSNNVGSNPKRGEHRSDGIREGKDRGLQQDKRGDLGGLYRK